MKRHWTINGRFLAKPGTGVQRCAREIVRSLDALIAGDPRLGDAIGLDIVAPLDADDPPQLRAIGFRRAGRLSGHLWEQAVLPGHTRDGLLSLCNTGPIRHRRQIVCMHDANTRICPESYSWGFRAAYRVLLPALGRSALAVTTVSRHSAAELARLGICTADRIRVIPNGHDHVARWLPTAPGSRRPVADRGTIVVIGSPARHKNVGLILSLARRLKGCGLTVAVVGAADPHVFRGTIADPADNVAWLGRVPDGDLAALLRDCLCLAFPSLTEGFGLPPLEAMALGCPVVVSDRASIPEVCGDAALYAPPDAPEAWLQHFVALSRCPRLRDALVARGLSRSAQFTWSGAAEGYLDTMLHVPA